MLTIISPFQSDSILIRLRLQTKIVFKSGQKLDGPDPEVLSVTQTLVKSENLSPITWVE
ncbi:hypothetical protein TanjilG_22407 [Lupinus angustifolius]|uniref:Uncharacterized protein n=1 Tax=Lupinus angustifolius TaxID=3871 RepID=A0A4P1RSJ3_LUPAN|nr:hypothetical protein TanjilG_22407 [Lupinus angustifolius]